MSAAAGLLTRTGASLDRETLLAGSVLAALGAAWLAGVPALSALVVIALVAVAALRPVAVVLALPATFGFVFQPISFGGPVFSPAELLIGATSVGLALRGAYLTWQGGQTYLSQTWSRARRELGSGFAPVALALLAVGSLSLLTVADPDYRRESLREFRWVIVEPVIAFALFRWYLRRPAELWRAAAFLGAGASVVAASAFLELTGGAGLRVEGVTRVSGVYPHPNALALFIERVVVFAALLAVIGRRPGWLPVAAFCGLALILTFSRGALLATTIVLVAALWFGGQRRMAALGAAGGAALLLAMVLIAAERLGSLFDGGSGSLRLAIWTSSLAMIRDYPLFGVGLDQFLYQYAPRYIDPAAWPERFTSHPHNLILDVWLRLGIMGLAVAAAFAWQLARAARRTARGSPLALAALGAVLVGALHGLVDNGYFLPDLALMLWFMAAVLDIESDQAGGGPDTAGQERG